MTILGILKGEFAWKKKINEFNSNKLKENECIRTQDGVLICKRKGRLEKCDEEKRSCKPFRYP